MSQQDKRRSPKVKTTTKPPMDLRNLFGVAFVLSFVLFFCFSFAFKNQFTNWDDGFYVTNNSSIKAFTLDNLKEMFSKLVTDVYVPLTLISFAIEYHFVKLQPFQYILDNIILHVCVTLLIFLFACKIGLKERAAFLGALLFGIHPMHVESVVWITERKDVLYSFFYMLAVLQYWRYLENGRIISFLWTIPWGILSMLAKPMALSLPFVLFVCDWLHERKIDRRVLLEKALHMMYIAPLAFLTFQAHYARAPLKDFVQGGMLWVWSFTFYLKKFFFPLTFLPIYNVPLPINFSQLDYNIAVLVFWLFVYLMIKHRQNRWVRFAFFFYFASIFFILRMKTEIHVSTVADRFMYLPSVGFCLLIGYFIDERLNHYIQKPRWKWKYITTVVISILLFCLLVLKTTSQIRVWKNSESLWALVIRTAPNSTAYNNQGQVFLDTKRYDLAIKNFDKAIEFLPSHFQAYYNKGLVFQEIKKFDEAIAAYDKALKLNPKYYQAYHNKSYVYLQQKKYDLAIDSCNKGLDINPKVEGMYSNRARAYLRLGKYDAAMKDTLKAKELGYTNADFLIKDINKAKNPKK